MKQSKRFASEQPENMEPKLLVIFVIDNSTAMTIGRMESINNFLNSFYKSIQQGDCHPFEEVMIDRLELCIITYSDSVQTLRKASLIGEHEVAPSIKRSTGNSNCIISAINEAIDIIKERKEIKDSLKSLNSLSSLFSFEKLCVHRFLSSTRAVRSA
jgi:uncharacterized protein YegL